MTPEEQAAETVAHDGPTLNDKPIRLLCGLFVGTATLLLAGGLWPFAWIVPLILGLVTCPWKPTRPFGVGAFAAACGAFIAVIVVA